MHAGEEPTRHTPDDENRRATRFRREPGTEFASVTHPMAARQLVEVCDESLGGIGLLVTERCGFRLGMTLQVEFAGAVFSGVVRHVTKRKSLGFVIGVRQVGSELLR